MTCRACGATIALKAIVCYKCGTPTADVPEVSRVPVSRLRGRIGALLCVFLVVVVALAVWLVPMTPDGTWMRWVALGAIPVVVFGGVRLIAGPHSSRLRRR